MVRTPYTPYKRTRLATLLLAGFAATPAFAIHTYEGDPGTAGNPASWRTSEFARDWGLLAIGSEFAYAAGYAAEGVGIGIVDSGFFAGHEQYDPLRYHGVTNPDGMPGPFDPAYNDTHGTHVSGTVGASRDGSVGGTNNFHGVAFNADLYIGNTGKTDSAFYGIPQAGQSTAQTVDNQHVADAYRAVAASGVRLIGTSWGSQPNTEQYQTLLPSSQYPGRAGLMGAWGYLVGDTGTDTWFQGALDAASSGTILLFSAGNGGYGNPSPRAAATYFDPALEDHWLGIAAIQQTTQTLNPDGSVLIPGRQVYNQCGVAKWGCMTAPGQSINGSTVTVQAGVPVSTYGNLSGTSMAQPHATGALAVIMERFPYMTNAQVLEVMKTTAVQNSTINNAAGTAVTNPTAGQRVQVPDDRNGWGTVSLRWAMNGPGQFTGRFAVDTQGHNDTWSNDISDVAIRARQAEDVAEAAVWEARKIEMGWTNGLPAGAPPEQVTEYNTGVAREAARESRIYAGSLAKSGAGVLTLTGANSYTGGTQVLGGTLVAASATALGTGDVSVLGGTLGLYSDDTVLITGNLSVGSAGWLDFGFDGNGELLLDIAGSTSLAGGAQISFADGFSSVGTYDLLDGAYSGSFSSLSWSGLAAGYTASLIYGAGGIDLSIAAVPEPETWALMMGGLALLAWARRRRG